MRKVIDLECDRGAAVATRPKAGFSAATAYRIEQNPRLRVTSELIDPGTIAISRRRLRAGTSGSCARR
jgi:hypothetical protein